MRKLALISGCSFCCLLAVAGCSPSSSSSDSAQKINGMAPGEYREKAEMRREIQSPGPKTGARP
jgi:hypothetical protein